MTGVTLLVPEITKISLKILNSEYEVSILWNRYEYGIVTFFFICVPIGETFSLLEDITSNIFSRKRQADSNQAIV